MRILGTNLVKRIGDTVPFDGERVATAAEVRGGPPRSRPLEGDARQAVEQVIRFQNANADNARAAAPVGIEGIPPPTMLQPLRNMVSHTFRHVNTVIRRISPVQHWGSQTGTRAEDAVAQRLEAMQARLRDEENAVARLTEPLTNAPWRRYLAAPPVSNVRSTRNVAPRPSSRHPQPRPRRRTPTRTSPRTARTAALIILDDSDVENAVFVRRTERQTERRQARRGQRNLPTEVIDLTGDNENIIDLTEDD